MMQLHLQHHLSNGALHLKGGGAREKLEAAAEREEQVLSAAGRQRCASTHTHAEANTALGRGETEACCMAAAAACVPHQTPQPPPPQVRAGGGGQAQSALAARAMGVHRAACKGAHTGRSFECVCVCVCLPCSLLRNVPLAHHLFLLGGSGLRTATQYLPGPPMLPVRLIMIWKTPVQAYERVAESAWEQSWAGWLPTVEMIVDDSGLTHWLSQRHLSNDFAQPFKLTGLISNCLIGLQLVGLEMRNFSHSCGARSFLSPRLAWRNWQANTVGHCGSWASIEGCQRAPIAA